MTNNILNRGILPNSEGQAYSSFEKEEKEIDFLGSALLDDQNNVLDEAQLKSLQARAKLITREKSKEAEDKTITRILQRSSSQPCIFSSHEKIELGKQACEARDGFL